MDRMNKQAIGGAANDAGVLFQWQVAAHSMALVLAQGTVPTPFGLPAGTQIRQVWCQAFAPVDDIVLETSDGGLVFIQAKRSLAFSQAESSDLASALCQFSLALTSSLPATGLPWDRRPFDRLTDALVIAVAHDSPASAEQRINGLSDLARGQTSWAGLTGVASQNRGHQQTLDTLLHHISRAAPHLSDDQRLALLQTLRIRRYFLQIDGSDGRDAWQILADSVLASASRVGDAWGQLCALPGELGPAHGSTDLKDLRRRLRDAGIALADAPDHRKDAATLRQLSEDCVSSIDDGIDCGDQGTMRIERDAVAEIGRLAAVGHVLIHGEPGVGKSWCAKQLVSSMADAALLLRVDDLPRVDTRQQLSQSLGLGHDLIDVLNAMGGGAPANLLVIDGLDAAREDRFARVVRGLVISVIRDTEWHVVATVRTFDLHHSSVFRELKSDAPGFAELQAARLSRDELETALNQVPQVGVVARDASPATCELIQVPFNLMLFCQVAAKALADGTDTKTLRAARNEVDLLHLHWEARCRCGDLATAREQLALNVAGTMLHKGELQCPRAAIAVTGQELRLLESDGLVRTAGRNSNFIAFQHNILADFAMAQVLIGLDAGEWTALLRDTSRLLFLRPSVRAALASLLLDLDLVADFWKLLEAVFVADDLPAIWRMLPSEVLTDYATRYQDVSLLAETLACREAPAWAEKVVFYLITSLLTRHVPVAPGRDGLWLMFAHAVSGRLSPRFVGHLLGYVEEWGKLAAGLSAEELRLTNECARSIHGFMLEREGPSRRSGMAAALVAHTYRGAPTESAALLLAVAERHHHQECFDVVHAMSQLLEDAPGLTADMMVAMFHHVECSEEKTAIYPSLVMPLASTVRQDWEMVWYGMANVVTALLDRDPASGVRAVIAAAESLVVAEIGGRGRRLPESVAVPWHGADLRYCGDGSSFWYGLHTHDHRRQAVDHLRAWLARQAVEGDAGAGRAESAFAALRAMNSLAVVWNAALSAAADAPALLAPLVLPLLTSAVVLSSDDSYHPAGQALTAAFAGYHESARESVEQAIVAIPELGEDERQVAALERRRDALLGCLREDSLTTAAAKARLAALRETGGPPANRPPFGDRVAFSDGQDPMAQFLRHQGVNTTTDVFLSVLNLMEPLERFESEHLNGVPSVEGCDAIATVALQLQEAIGDPSVDDRQRVLACQSMTAVARLITRNATQPADAAALQWGAAWLEEAATDALPAAEAEDDAGDDTHAINQSPRAQAAEGLLRLVARPETRTQRRTSLMVGLLFDRSSDVRWEVARHLYALRCSDTTLMWAIIDWLARHEKRPRVLRELLDGLARIGWGTSESLSALLTVIERRPKLSKHAELDQTMWADAAGLAVWIGAVEARGVIQRLLAEPITDDGVYSSMLHATREALVWCEDGAATPSEAVRSRAIALYWAIADAAVQQKAALDGEWADQPYAEVPECVSQRYGVLLQVLNWVAANVYFASGLLGEKQAKEQIVSDSQRETLIDEAFGLLELIASVAHPAVVHYLLDLLEGVVHLRPQKCVSILHLALAGDGQLAPSHFESLITDSVVRLCEVLLADHRDLLERDAGLRSQLLDVLDGFVETGWPQARRLVFRLEGPCADAHPMAAHARRAWDGGSVTAVLRGEPSEGSGIPSSAMAVALTGAAPSLVSNRTSEQAGRYTAMEGDGPTRHPRHI